MIAIQFGNYGAPDVLRLASVELPEAKSGEVRVRLQAAGVAQFDTKLRKGLMQASFPLQLPKIPGRDGVGVIDQLGEGVSGLAIGDPVCVMAEQVLAGTYAEAVVCAMGRVVPSSPSFSVTEAAALIQPANSAWIAVMETAGVQAGMRILIHGGSGSVGSMMVQLCGHLGAEVSATCSTQNLNYVASLGVVRAIAYDREEFGKLRDQDVVFDMVGGETHARSYPVLRRGGHLVYLNAAPVIDQSDLFDVKVTRARITDRPEVFRAVAALAKAGVLRPRVGSVFTLGDAAKAHAELESGRPTHGRPVLITDGALGASG